MTEIAQAALMPPPHIEQRGAGAPVLLLHGWGASIQLFEPHLNTLSRSYHVTALDFPGFGQTPPPPAAWSVHDYAAWVLQILDRHGIERPHIVGHSFGGRVAISIAAQHPERVGKLVLTGSAGIRPKRSVGYHLRVRSFKLMRWLAQTAWLPAALRETARQRVAALGSSDYQQASGTVRASFVRVVNEDLRDLLPKIKASTLLVWGADDQDTPLADGQLMEKLIPDAGLVVFEGAGHYAYLEQAARFCTIVDTFFKG